MTDISYQRGDATQPQGGGPKILCHVCNDSGGWGRGFVVAISKRWKQPEVSYRDWYKAGRAGGFCLGAVTLVQVEPELWVANMVAQHGVRTTKVGPPIRYDALAQCLERVATEALARQATAHMPRIGCGLAGGEWSEVERLLMEHLVNRGVRVTVYDFE